MNREARRAVRTVAFLAMLVALLVLVYLHFGDVAPDDQAWLLKAALIIIGVSVTLHGTEHITRVVRLDFPGGRISVGDEGEGR